MNIQSAVIVSRADLQRHAYGLAKIMRELGGRLPADQRTMLDTLPALMKAVIKAEGVIEFIQQVLLHEEEVDPTKYGIKVVDVG